MKLWYSESYIESLKYCACVSLIHRRLQSRNFEGCKIKFSPHQKYGTLSPPHLIQKFPIFRFPHLSRHLTQTRLESG